MRQMYYKTVLPARGCGWTRAEHRGRKV